MLTPVEVLKAAIAQMTPETWTQGYWARDAEGDMCYTFDPKAVCWCSTGWVHKLTGPGGPNDFVGKGIGVTHRFYWQVIDLIRKVLPEESQGSVAVFNDSHTFEEVKELWEEALKVAEEEENGTVRES